MQLTVYSLPFLTLLLGGWYIFNDKIAKRAEECSGRHCGDSLCKTARSLNIQTCFI
jgi:hypothetical protein